MCAETSFSMRGKNATNLMRIKRLLKGLRSDCAELGIFYKRSLNQEMVNGDSVSLQALMKSAMIQSLPLLVVFKKFEGVWDSEVEGTLALQDHICQL